MNNKIVFNEKSVYKIYKNMNQMEILEYLADKLYNLGYVEKNYKSSVIEREKEFPTGLFMGGINVAIPHTEGTYVKRSAVAVGILDNSVEFNSMDGSDKIVKVSIVIMLALDNSNDHVEMLAKIIKLIKNQKRLKELISTNNETMIYKLMSNYLLN